MAAEKADPVKEPRVENEGPIQVTTGGGYEAFESPNGQVLYYIKSRDRREIWSVPRDGGPERLVVAGPRESRWAVTARGILFLDGANVRLYNFPSGDVEDLGAIPTGQVPSYGFSASPDGRYFLWSQTDRRTADLWAAEILLPRKPAF